MRSILGWLNKYKSIAGLFVAAVLLLLAQSTFWLNHTIFDQQTFTGIVKETIATEDSREAIATTVVNQALADRPIVNRLVGSKASQLVAGLLGTDLAGQTFDTVINKTYAYLTSSNPQDITVDLLAIKTPLAGLISFAESQGREVTFDATTIPDSITLFDASDLPDIHSYSVTLLWLGPIFWAGALVLFGAYLYRGRRAYAKRVYIVGSVIILTSFIGMLVGPLLPPPIIAQVPIIELRGVVSNLIRGMLDPFVRQMYLMAAVTLIALLVFNQRFNILGVVQKLGRKMGQAAGKKPATKKPKKP